MTAEQDELVETQVTVLRHGQCLGGDIFRGRFDAQISTEGLAQMQAALANVADHWDVIISSPLRRCSEFALQAAADAQCAYLENEHLQEMAFGDWDGQRIADIWQQQTPLIQAWSNDPAANTPPNGESLAAVAQRAERVWQTLLQHYAGKKVLLVTHGGFIRVLLTHLLGMPLANANRWQVPYACVSRLSVLQAPHQPPRFQLVGHNL